MDWDDLLRRAAAARRTAIERALAPLELTAAQFAVLRLVVERPGNQQRGGGPGGAPDAADAERHCRKP